MVENVVKMKRNVLRTRFDQIHVKQITYAIQFICMNVTAQPIYPWSIVFLRFYLVFHLKKKMEASGTLQHLQCGYLSINTCRTWLISVNIQGIQLFPRKNISVNKDVNHKYNSCSFKGAYLHNYFSRISINEIAIHHVQCVMNKRTSASTCWY